jgi:phosphoglycolate phosphatase
MSKLAVVFPGIGYTVDKPLLYFSRKIAAENGYEIKLLPYTGFPAKILGDREKMTESYRIALMQSRKMLADVDFTVYNEILFIGKSIGTIVASAYAKQHGLQVRSVLFTPLADTFQFLDAESDAAAFHGTADPWANTDEISKMCEELQIPLYLTDRANHSLETGDVETDLNTLTETMRIVKAFL